MERSHSNLSVQGHPFPNARQAGAKTEEDKFMAEHGGWGARLIFVLAQLIMFRR